MPTAKPQYDGKGKGSWKTRKVRDVWGKPQLKVQQQLRPFYPDKNADAESPFGHPSDEWAIILLSLATSTISQVLWQELRLTNEQLKAEQRDLLKTLNSAISKLGSLSHDFSRLLGHDANPLGCRDMIRELIPHVEAARQRIGELLPAIRPQEAEHDAAIAMATSVLRHLKETGVAVAATGDPDFVEFSDAVKILKILGDAVHLRLAKVTWRDVIIEVKKQCSDLSS